jgi:hypothetical protein
MSYLQLIPDTILEASDRSAFLNWIRSMPLPFHARLRIYFAWLDYNSASYTADEIDSLNIREKIVEPEPTD